ncbi:DUF2620 domain-containing protein [Bacillus canaveralius]|uniref:DUF2620 domain-containing protein n=1 Tax=Bacillus canaveralius TaxID=1403243 RepID=A0A2N5GM70_9BACI|nr:MULTISPECIES: DUF2620 domain-containing protein [Bacillus]PLR80603.1 DUF2620 domain-containing protein [Bacillus sp. V33-4]PLR82956.1 DUF2620 domain-containing protein [Bacillus canaveralius]PLR97039.1 DUF2620 domain-containing protein [Bacillus canaveralius]
MLRIVVGGLKKDVTERAVKAAGGDKVQVTVTSDFEGAKKVKAGDADYYLGACNSGGGAALSVAIGILGYANCSTVAKNGKKPNAEEIQKLVNDGKIAFGMAVEGIEESVPVIINSLLKKHGLE